MKITQLALSSTLLEEVQEIDLDLGFQKCLEVTKVDGALFVKSFGPKSDL